jgi:hypothetical protein
MYFNGHEVGTSTLSNWSIWPIDAAEENTTNGYIGSYMGYLYFFKGMMQSFAYSPSILAPTARVWRHGHYTNGSFHETLICEFNEYLSGTCKQCDSSCK